MALFETKKETVLPEVAECDKQLAALEQRKNETIRTIGQLFVQNNTSASAAGTVYEPYMKSMEQMAAEVVVLEKRKLAAQGLRKCEKCGNILVLDSAFCNKCGEKLAPLFATPAPAAAAGICSKCGAAHNPDAQFCTNCGNNLKAN